MTPEQMDALALDIASILMDKRGGSRMDDSADLFTYSYEFAKAYRKALAEKIEPIYCGNDATPLYSPIVHLREMDGGLLESDQAHPNAFPVFTAAQLQQARAEGAVNALREAAEEWLKAYPEDVFPEPDFKKVRWALDGAHTSLDCVSASIYRHVLTQLLKMAAELRVEK